MATKTSNVWSVEQQRLLTILGGIIIVAAIAIPWIQSADNPSQIFWSAIGNNLSTTGVTIGTTQSSSGEKEQQLVQVGFGAHPLVKTLIVLSSVHSTVKTEDLDTPSAEYTKYDQIQTGHRGKSGKLTNFSSAIGVWAQTGTTAPVETSPASYGQVLLSLALPFGDLTTSQRSQLIAQIRNDQVYTANFAHVQKETFEGRAAYAYQVSIQPLPYIRLLKRYAADMDLHQLDQVNPNNYSGQPAVTMSWVVDAHAKQLLQVNYSNGRIETYSGYGVPIMAAVPVHPITSTALQQRVSQLLKS